MAAPEVLSRATSVSSTTSTEAWTPTLPTVTPGKSLLVWVSADGDDRNATKNPGWTKLGQRSHSTFVTGVWYWKPRALGGGLDTLNLYNDTTEQYSAIAWCIDAGDNPQIAWSFSDGLGINSNPPALNLGVAREALWIATRAGDRNVVATAAPSGFGNFQSRAGGGNSGASSNSAERTETTASLDPGNFTSGSEPWVCSTLAIWRGDEGIPYILQYAQSDMVDLKRSSCDAELPNAATKDNWLVAFVLPDKNPTVITPPSGFSVVGSPQVGGSREIAGGVYVKKAAGGEKSFTASWNTDELERGGLVVLEIAGSDGPDQWDAGGSPTSEARSASAGPVTPTTPMQLALAMFANDSAWNAGDGLDHTWTDGFIPFASFLPTGALDPTGDPAFALATRLVPEPAPVETEFSYTGGNADQTLMLLLTMKPLPQAPSIAPFFSYWL